MLKVLDLFSGTQSVRKALDEMGIKYEYKGIDIYSPEEENIILDLTQDNIVEKVKEVLGDWKPDFIWASPVCNKFSTACAATGGNLFFEKVGKDDLKVRENFNVSMNPIYKKPQNWPRYQKEARFALKMHNNMKKIIDYFNVNFAIENPRRAMSKYLYKDYIANYVTYCMYSFDYQKPTAIYSNKKINLLYCNHKERHRIMLSGNKKDYVNGVKNMSNYAKRSSVPTSLIKSIVEQIMIK